MKKRRSRADCPSPAVSVEDIMDPTVSPMELARISPTERRRELLQILELTEVAAEISGRNKRTIEKLAVLVGKSVCVNLREKRLIMTCPALLRSPRLWLLMDVLQDEQRALERLYDAFHLKSVA